jgi:hypothetical protein
MDENLTMPVDRNRWVRIQVTIELHHQALRFFVQQLHHRTEMANAKANVLAQFPAMMKSTQNHATHVVDQLSLVVESVDPRYL